MVQFCGLFHLASVILSPTLEHRSKDCECACGCAQINGPGLPVEKVDKAVQSASGLL